MPMPMPAEKKCFRKRKPTEDEEEADSSDEESRRLALEEVKFLQKKRERRSGIPALPVADPSVAELGDQNGGGLKKSGTGGGGDGEKDDLVLQDTFAQETAVTIEDPNMLTYVEQELAKQRGKGAEGVKGDLGESELKRLEDELYAVPDHLKVKRRNSEETSTQWTTGIAEVQLPIEFKLKNIEETEAAKKLLQEKRLAGKAKSELNIPSSFAADYFHRGRDYAVKLRREHPELYKDRGGHGHGDKMGPKVGGSGAADVVGRRQAATDEIMLERFRKRERQRVMRR